MKIFKFWDFYDEYDDIGGEAIYFDLDGNIDIYYFGEFNLIMATSFEEFKQKHDIVDDIEEVEVDIQLANKVLNYIFSLKGML